MTRMVAMPTESEPTRSQKEEWERECLELLRRYLELIPTGPVEAVAKFMIEVGDFAPCDLIEASDTDRRAWDALQLVVRWLKNRNPVALLASPLLDWAVDAGDGTLYVPSRKSHRPSTGHPLFRDHVIATIVGEIADIRLRPVYADVPNWQTSASVCHMVGAVVNQAAKSIRNIYYRYRKSSPDFSHP